ncbi:MAG: DNA-binding response regulator [Bacillaceae bacterium G1]|nr:DNA-binding response regulator [Bacillota bacterium]OJF17273.1 MAG: DNA-binding response regulator [Bacillaceae bacterium G1]
MAQSVLVVDDEEAILTLVEFNLKKAGFSVSKATDGYQALQMVYETQPDLIILDIMLPSMDGLEVCKQLRQKGLRTPVLMLSARDEVADKVIGLELGADDYMTKPFSPRELVARVKALLRRVQSEPAERAVISVGDLTLNREKYEVRFRGRPLELTPKEFEILSYMMQHCGRVLSRDQLLNAVWDYEFTGDTRIVDVHVSHLREKIEPDPKQPVYIKTVRGIGYKFEGPS